MDSNPFARSTPYNQGLTEIGAKKMAKWEREWERDHPSFPKTTEVLKWYLMACFIERDGRYCAHAYCS